MKHLKQVFSGLADLDHALLRDLPETELHGQHVGKKDWRMIGRRCRESLEVGLSGQREPLRRFSRLRNVQLAIHCHYALRRNQAQSFEEGVHAGKMP